MNYAGRLVATSEGGVRDVRLRLWPSGQPGRARQRQRRHCQLFFMKSTTPGAGMLYLRIDCSELTESHRVSQLLGAPPGYVGHTDGAPLIDQLTANLMHRGVVDGD